MLTHREHISTEGIKHLKSMLGCKLEARASVAELDSNLIQLSELFLSLEEDAVQLEIKIHKRAQDLLKRNLLEEAWMTLLSFNNL